jgi:hypothetical protein
MSCGFAERLVARAANKCLNECLIDHDVGSDIGQFSSRPGFHLLSHRLEVALHPVNTHRNAIDEGE